jgi:hypothetical protein
VQHDAIPGPEQASRRTGRVVAHGGAASSHLRR